MSQNIDLATLPLNYSYQEQDTGLKFVDDRKIYKKSIYFGALPNATLKTVAHGISGITTIIDMKAVAWNNSGTSIMLPYTNSVSAQYQIDWYCDRTNININTGDNKSGYSVCIVTLWYTKS